MQSFDDNEQTVVISVIWDGMAVMWRYDADFLEFMLIHMSGHAPVPTWQRTQMSKASDVVI